MSKIFINPGHYPGIDPGAVNDDYEVCEADIALDIGRRVSAYLTAAGCNVQILQSNNLCGEYPAHASIVDSANEWGADLFVSIHCNAAANPAAKGTECLVFSDFTSSARAALCIQKQIVDSLGTVDRGVKERPGFAVLKRTSMSAVLVELAFISNTDDCCLLLEQPDEFARAIARGVTDYLQKEE